MFLLCLASNGQDTVESAAKTAFELFKKKKFKKIIKTQFADEADFWDYTWKSIGKLDSLNTNEIKKGMEDLRLEFKNKLLIGLDKAFQSGIDKYGIEWNQIDEYKIEIQNYTAEIGEHRYDRIIPVVSFRKNGQKLMWRFDTYILTNDNKYKIVSKKPTIGKYKPVKGSPP